MRARNLMWILGALLLSLTAFAGGKKCQTHDVQECLNKKITAYQNKAWLGVKTEKVEDSMFARIVEVVPGSPAEAAGFRKGDILAAINGVVLTEENKDDLKKIKKTLAIGDKVHYIVKRKSGKAKLTATLAKPPSDVVAAWIGWHMMYSHTTVTIAAND